MKDLNCPVTTYCKKKCYADHVIEGRLDYLVKDWERTVAHIARGYLEIMKYDYLSDMDGRQIIHDFLRVATEDQKIRLKRESKQQMKFTSLIL